MTDPIVGIDLGTSNSVVAHADAAGPVKVLADDGGYKIHPSVVSFHPNGGVVVGAAAKQRKVIDPQHTIYSVKRLIGRGFNSPEVQTARGRVPYQIKEGSNQAPVVVTRGGEFAIPEISAIVLDHVRNIAAARLATEVARAVVTVPASFNDAQRSATATAGAIAGLTVVRVLNEPTAAALAYGHTRNLRETIAVYDFGGGTFDITILRLDNQVYEVLGTSGNTFLGGDDLDERLVDKMVAKFLAENRIDLRSNEVSMMRLRAVAEQTKIELSRRTRAVVRVDEIAYGPRGAPLNLQIEITRDEFVTQVADIIDRTFPVCREALQIAGLGVDGIADVILVGGTTKIPYVRDQVSRFFSKAPRTDVNPEDAVAVGAALQGAALERMLARPRGASARVSVQTATGESDSMSSLTDALALSEDSVTMQPSELQRPARVSADYAQGAEPRPDTSYSITRGAAGKDVYAEKPGNPLAPTSGEITRPSVQTIQPNLQDFDTRTPPPAQPLGRMTRQNVTTPTAPLVPPNAPAAGAGKQTLFGVAPGPELPRGAEPPPIPRGRGQPRPETAPTATGPALDLDTSVRTAPKPVPRPFTASDDFTDEGPVHSLTPAPQPVMTQPLPTAMRLPHVPPGASPGSAGPPAFPSAAAPPPSFGPAAGPPFPSAGPPPFPSAGPPPFPAAGPPPFPAAGPPPFPAAGPSPFPAAGPPPFPAAGPALGPPAFPPSTNPGQPPPVPAARASAPPPLPSPATTLPLAPLTPIAPPTAPTLVALAPDFAAEVASETAIAAASAASTARGMGPANTSTLVASGEPYPATTARGFQPPPAPSFARTVLETPPPSPVLEPPAPVILEVTPRGLGIGTVAGYCEELIRRNSRVPAETRKLFTTARDRQDVVRIVICQGESRRLDHNVVIGDLVLQDLPPRPRGETSIEVTFFIDASGILQVRARDALTGRAQEASLDLVGGMPDVAGSRDRIQQLRR